MAIESTENRKIFDELYHAFFALPYVSFDAKRRSFETLIQKMPNFVLWEIIGITPLALSQLAEINFVDFKGLQRSHCMSRLVRGREMFDRRFPMDDAFEYYFKHDKTVLATKSENRKDNFSRDQIIEVDNDVFGKHNFGVIYTKKRAQYLNNIYCNYKELTSKSKCGA